MEWLAVEILGDPAPPVRFFGGKNLFTAGHRWKFAQISTG
jgi:hypothetical protein